MFDPFSAGQLLQRCLPRAPQWRKTLHRIHDQISQRFFSNQRI
jgi:hypothetical protein